MFRLNPLSLNGTWVMVSLSYWDNRNIYILSSATHLHAPVSRWEVSNGSRSIFPLLSSLNKVLKEKNESRRPHFISYLLWTQLRQHRTQWRNVDVRKQWASEWRIAVIAHGAKGTGRLRNKIRFENSSLSIVRRSMNTNNVYYGAAACLLCWTGARLKTPREIISHNDTLANNEGKNFASGKFKKAFFIRWRI